MPTLCPSCHSSVTGNFCSQCGAAAGPRRCVACQAELSPQARFCHRCGAAAGAEAPAAATGASPAAASAVAAPRAGTGPWITAAAIIAVLLGAILWKASRPAATNVPDMANPGAAGTPGAEATPPAGPFAGGGVPQGRAPDISRMSPQERFARLNDRVMQAGESGDTAFVRNFTPMALGAYAQLDSIDIDSRYHAAMLHLGVRDYAPALALADTIDTESKNNLYASLIRATAAQLRGDSAAVRRERATFRQHFAAEIAKKRPEYEAHRQMLEAFGKQTS